MPKENDLEGTQDQGGKHGDNKGMPKHEPKPPRGDDADIVRDDQKRPKQAAK